ncbi:MAG: aldolase/citrate lyase family protein [Burkholderiaceae bacterium]
MQSSNVLFREKLSPVSLTVCAYYASAEKLMRRLLALQQELLPVFDVTLDCLHGKGFGTEVDHVRLIQAMVANQESYFDPVGIPVHDVLHASFEPDVEILCRLATHRLAFVTVPKVDGLANDKWTLFAVNRRARFTGRVTLPVHVVVETQSALADAFAIAALLRVQTLSFGIMDFVSSHYGAIPFSAMRSRGQFGHPLMVRANFEIAAACYAYGKIASRNVTTEIKDSAFVANDATHAADEFAYSRMWSIDSDQIKPNLTSFTRRISEVDDPSAILIGAQAHKWGPIHHNGTLHDRPTAGITRSFCSVRKPATYRLRNSPRRSSHLARHITPAVGSILE